MASRKLIRDMVLSKQPLFLHLRASQQLSTTRLGLLSANGDLGNRQFSALNKFSKTVKGEVNRNPEFQQSVKELKEKAEGLKVRTKQTTEQLHKHVDGVWTEAAAAAKEVSANFKEKISSATEEVKGTFGIGKEESSGSTSESADFGGNVKDESKETAGEAKHQQSGLNDTAETIFGKFKSNISSASPKVSLAFQRLKEAKVVDLAKKGYGIVKDELSGNTNKRKHLRHEASSSSAVDRSARIDIVIVPQSPWSKKWETFKGKMQGHPIFKRIGLLSEPVVTKSQEMAEDMREKWETSDHPVVHKIQDLNDSVFGETDAALSFKEIRRRDPSFSLPDFVADVQEVIKPVLNAYIKGDVGTLKKYCCREVIDRCNLEHSALQSHGIFMDNKILHISEVELRETKMMGSAPIIIVAFQTQQVYCVRDREGLITEGGKDTIHTVYYAWAMQQIDVDELGEGALYPIWRLREMQQLGVQALI